MPSVSAVNPDAVLLVQLSDSHLFADADATLLGMNTRESLQRVVELVREEAGELAGLRVAVLGLAFKPHSDDIRDSPALDVAVRLADAGAIVTATDPEAIPNSRRRAPQLAYAATAEEAAADADIVVLITEWPEFRGIDPVAFGAIVGKKRVIDGRNVLDPASWRAAGWSYRGLGR